MRVCIIQKMLKQQFNNAILILVFLYKSMRYIQFYRTIYILKYTPMYNEHGYCIRKNLNLLPEELCCGAPLFALFGSNVEAEAD